MRTARRRFSLAAAVVLSGAAVSAGTVALTEGDRTNTRTVTVSRVQTVQRSAAATSPEDVYRRSRGALVSITSRTGDGTATGTGFLTSPDGYIVTNAHVVDGASSVTVRVGEGAVSHTAQVVGKDT